MSSIHYGSPNTLIDGVEPALSTISTQLTTLNDEESIASSEQTFLLSASVISKITDFQTIPEDAKRCYFQVQNGDVRWTFGSLVPSQSTYVGRILYDGNIIKLSVQEANIIRFTVDSGTPLIQYWAQK